MPFDEEELDPHGECAAEIKKLRDLLQEARDHIGSMPSLDSSGQDQFFKILRLVTRLEDALYCPKAEDVRGILAASSDGEKASKEP